MKTGTYWLPIGLVVGGGAGIVAGILMDNLSMGIVFGAGFGLVAGLAMSYVTGQRKST